MTTSSSWPNGKRRVDRHVYAALEPISWKELRDACGFIHDIAVDERASHRRRDRADGRPRSMAEGERRAARDLGTADRM